MTAYQPEHATAPTLSGMITGMPDAVYHSRPEISKHDCDLVARAPVLYRDKIALRTPPTPAMEDGTILGAILLGLPITDYVAVCPDDAPAKPTSRQRFAKKPSDDTLDAIRFWDGFQHTVNDRIIKSESQISGYFRISQAILESPEVSKLLGFPVASEVSMFWTCPTTGLSRRGRPDRLRQGNIVIDLKKTACAEANAFQRAIAQYRYDVQAAEYVDALKLLTGEDWRFYWICYETEAPYLTACYEASDLMLTVGRARRDAALAKLQDCITTGNWPGYQTGIPQIDPPKFLIP